MKVLVIGKNGQVGWELNRVLLPLGDVTAIDRTRVDISDLARLQSYLQKSEFDVLVNAAAYTAVDQAETQQDMAFLLNAQAIGVLAEQAEKNNALLVHYSTDYVFDGSKEDAYLETDQTCPINIYGESKLAGEQALQACGCDYLVFRTSWVYSKRGNNFLLSMLRLAAQREELNIVADQYGAPTWARLIADVTAHAIRQSMQERQQRRFKSDLYHLTSTGYVSWHGFAEAIINHAREQDTTSILAKTINPITTEEYPVPAKRPLNSRLSSAKLQQHFGLQLPDWQTALALCMD